MAKSINTSLLSREGFLSRRGAARGGIINPNPINNPNCLGTNCSVAPNFVADFRAALKDAIESFAPSASYSQTIGITTPNLLSSIETISSSFTFGVGNLTNIITYNNVQTPYQFQIITNSGTPVTVGVPFYQCVRIQDVVNNICPTLNFCFKAVLLELTGFPGIYYYDVLDIKVCMCDPVTHTASEYDNCIQCVNSNSRCIANGTGARRVGGGTDFWEGTFTPGPFPVTIADPNQWDVPITCAPPIFTISNIGGQSAVVHSYDPVTGTFVIEVTGGTPPDGLHDGIITADFGSCGVLHLLVRVDKNHVTLPCNGPEVISNSTQVYGPTGNVYPGVTISGPTNLSSCIGLSSIASIGVVVGLNTFTLKVKPFIVPPDSCCASVVPDYSIIYNPPPYLNSITFTGYEVGDDVTLDINASILTTPPGFIHQFVINPYKNNSSLCRNLSLDIRLHNAATITTVCPPNTWPPHFGPSENLSDVFPPDKRQNIGGFNHLVLSVSANTNNSLTMISPTNNFPSNYINLGYLVSYPYFASSLPLCVGTYGNITSTVPWLEIYAEAASLPVGRGVAFVLKPGHPPIGSTGTIMVEFESPNMGTFLRPLRYVITA